MQTPTLRMNGTVIDPADAVRSARDLQVPDARDLLRGLDAVPGRVDTALGASSAARSRSSLRRGASAGCRWLGRGSSAWRSAPR